MVQAGMHPLATTDGMLPPLAKTGTPPLLAIPPLVTLMPLATTMDHSSRPTTLARMTEDPDPVMEDSVMEDSVMEVVLALQ